MSIHGLVSYSIRHGTFEAFLKVFQFNRDWHKTTVGAHPLSPLQRCTDCDTDGHRASERQWGMLFYVKAVAANRLDIVTHFEEKLKIELCAPSRFLSPSNAG